jgi:hypothetical protein
MERLQKYFLALLLIQAAHSCEEYLFRFYDAFPLIPFMAGFFHTIPQAIFFILNYQLILFLGAVFLISFARERWFYFALTIFASIELLNGMVHVGTALVTLNYFPGAATGVFYIPTSIYILLKIRKNGRAA